MKKKPLTGWLVLLIIILGPVTFGQTGVAFANIDSAYQPLLSQFPSLPLALTVYKSLMVSSVCVSLFTAFVLYRRRPGSLGIAQAGLAVRAVLMIAASIMLPMLAGLPPDVTQASYSQIAGPSAFILMVTGVWYLYLLRSRRVLEIFTT